MAFEFKDAEIRTMKLDDLTPAEYNPRKITKKAFRGLGRSIKDFGFMVPIVWNERSGNIVGGHQRFRHLKELGETETEVVVVDLDDKEEVALNIALNNPKIRGQFTPEAVGLLKLTEARLGNAFKELGLFDLHEAIAKQLKENRKNIQGPPKPPTGGEPPPILEPEAIVTCPECSSRWLMKNRHVLHDATKDSSKTGGSSD